MSSKFLLAILLVAGSASAAVAPYYQRNNELTAVIQHEDVESAVTAHSATARGGSGQIDGIAHFGRIRGMTIGGNGYRVTSGSCTLEVTVQHRFRTGVAGPPELVITVPKDMSCPRGGR